MKLTSSHALVKRTVSAIALALAHLQLETIHPPLLYPSLYFKQHSQQYYGERNVVRASGDYERWIDFISEAFRHSAEVAIETGSRVTQVIQEDRAQLLTPAASLRRTRLEA